MTEPYQFLETDDIRQIFIRLKTAICWALDDAETAQRIDEALDRFSRSPNISPPVAFIVHQMAHVHDSPEAAPVPKPRNHLKVVK